MNGFIQVITPTIITIPEPTEPTTPEPTEPSTPGTDTSTDNTTGYVWFDRRNLYNIFDRL